MPKQDELSQYVEQHNHWQADRIRTLIELLASVSSRVQVEDLLAKLYDATTQHEEQSILNAVRERLAA